MLRVSQTAKYALRATLFIAARRKRGPVRVDEMALALRVPRNYLSKTLHRLARAHVLTSTRGPLGGFVLGRPAHRLTVGEIVAPFSRTLSAGCLLRRGPCRLDEPCSAHAEWRRVTDRTRVFLDETTVADLLRQPARGR